MKKVFILTMLSLMFFACKESESERKSRFFRKYMEEHFPDFKIKDGEYLFILPGGCESCKKGCINVLLSMQLAADKEDMLNKNYVAMFISEKTAKERYSSEILTLHNTVLLDTTNKLDKMSFGIFGIAVLKIKDKQIVAHKSMTIEDYEKGFENFFKTRL